MKVAIVDDIAWELEPAQKLLEGAGHEVLVLEPRRREQLAEVVQQITAFGPDIILFDHYLNDGERFTGDEVQYELSWPRKRSVGISSISQDYVSWRLHKSSLTSRERMEDFLAEVARIAAYIASLDE